MDDYGYSGYFPRSDWTAADNLAYGHSQIKVSTPNRAPSKSLIWADGWKASQQINGSYVFDNPWRRNQYLSIGIYAAHPGGMNQVFFDVHAEKLNYVWCNDSTSRYMFNVWDKGNIINRY